MILTKAIILTLETTLPNHTPDISSIGHQSTSSMKPLILCGLLISLSSGSVLAQGNLTVNIKGLKSNKGQCKLWLWHSADGFPTDEKKAVKSVEMPIAGLASQYVFENLPAGDYAVTAIHDQNGNHRFDTNFFGIAKEAFGCTNNVRGGLSGPPKFEPAKIIVPKNGLTVAMDLK